MIKACLIIYEKSIACTERTCSTSLFPVSCGRLGKVVEMRKSILFAIITFFVAFSIGIFRNPSWVDSLLRAVLSALIILVGNAIIMTIIQRFLPELLLMQGGTNDNDEDRDFDAFLHKDLMSSNAESDASGLGQSVDIVLDEKTPMQSYGSGLGESTVPNQFSATDFVQASMVSVSSPQSSLDKKKEAFVREDPAILAKMVRTRLSDDD